MNGNLLFSLPVFGEGGHEGSVEEAGHAEEHEDSVGAEVSVAIHGDAPEWEESYLTMEYLWKRKPMLVTTMWLT